MAETHYKANAPLGQAMGAFCCFVFGLTSFFGSIFVHGPMIPIMFLWPWLYRRMVEIGTSMWEALVVATMGWAMQGCGYIFLERNWEIDKEHLTRMLNHCVALKAYPNYLFFPEGTDLTEKTKAASDRFAKKNGLQKYDYVLHPRTTGFVHMVDTLRQVGELQAVLDITVAYPKSLVQAETRLFFGEVPEEVHFHIKRYEIKELPKDENGLSEWCKQRWKEKEEMLRAYFNDECETMATQNVTANRRFPNNKIPQLSERGLLLWFSIAGWLAFLVLSIIFVIVSPTGQLFSLLIILFHFAQSRLFGGVEKFELLVYEMLQGRKNNIKPTDKANQESYEEFVKKEE